MAGVMTIDPCRRHGNKSLKKDISKSENIDIIRGKKLRDCLIIRVQEKMTYQYNYGVSKCLKSLEEMTALFLTGLTSFNTICSDEPHVRVLSPIDNLRVLRKFG